MRACSSEVNSLAVFFIDKKPIGLYVTFPVALVVALQFMVSVLRIQLFLMDELFHDFFDQLKIETSAFGFIELSLERPQIDRY